MPLYLLNNGSVDTHLDIDGVDMPLTFSVADMKRPDKRKTSSSKTITLKGTAKNMRVLKNVYNLTGANLDQQILQFSFDPRVRVECIYEEDGIVLFDGLFQVLRSIKKGSHYTFECVLFSNIANIYNKLKDITIADLDWSEYNHVLDKDTIQDSWDTSVKVNGVDTSNFTSGIPDGFGYIYSWFDLGYSYVSGTPARQRTNQLIIGVYFKEVLQKIMEFVGQEYNFSMNNEELFKRLTIFNEGGEIPKISASEIALREVDRDDQISAETDYSVQDPVSPVNASGNYSANLSINYRNLLGKFTTAVNQDSLSQVQPSGNQVRYVRIAKTGLYNINCSGNIYFSLVGYDFTDVTWNKQIENSSVTVLKNGQPMFSTTLAVDINVSATKQEANISYNFENDLFLNSGDEIEVRVNYSATYSVVYDSSVSKPDMVTLTLESKTDNQNINITAIEDDIQDGSDVIITRYLSRLKCSNFLRSLMRMFNLYQTEDNGVINLTPAKDYYGSTGVSDTDDWSELVDYSEDVIIEPPNRIEGKFYEMLFSEENDFYNQKYRDEFSTNYGDKIYEISNTWQEGTNEIKLDFAQSVPVQLPTSSVIMPAIYKSENGVVEPFKGKSPRVFFYNGLVEVPQDEACSIHPSNGDWAFADTGTPLNIDNGVTWAYPSFHHTLNVENPEFDLTFELPKRVFYNSSVFTTGNMWSVYWNKFIEELTSSDAKILTAYIKLNKSNIKDISFSRLKNIDGVLYRLNMVSDYMVNNNVTTMCEFIKIIKGDKNITSIIDAGVPAGALEDATTTSGGVDDDSTGTGVTSGGYTQELDSTIIQG